MTAKDRWRTVFEGGCPGLPVSDYWATAEVTRRLLADLGCRTEPELWRALGVDKCIFLAPKHPRAREDTWHIPSLFSIWNIETVLMPCMDGLGVYEEAVNPPLACAETAREIDEFPWPEAREWDVSGLRAECERWEGFPILGASYEPFYLYSRLRGMDAALTDVATNSPVLEAAMERIYDIHAGIVRAALDAAGDLIDFIYVAEDLGTQQSLMMSPKAFRRHIKPWLARMIDLAHSYGARAFHHDDGAIFPLIPDLIEIGVDVLNPVQWRCRGMERERLAAEFGRDLVFHGGMDNQQTLPFGTPADVRQQVLENVRIFKSCKGYVVAPCHNMQVNTPTRNIVALYDAIRECQ